MKKETVDKLIQLLTLIAHHSREYALKLKAFEQVAKKHPEIFRAYEESLEELRSSALAQESHEHTEEALEALSAESLRDHDQLRSYACQFRHARVPHPFSRTLRKGPAL